MLDASHFCGVIDVLDNLLQLTRGCTPRSISSSSRLVEASVAHASSPPQALMAASIAGHDVVPLLCPDGAQFLAQVA